MARTDAVGVVAQAMLHIPHEVQPGLRERYLGPWEGRPWEEVEKAFNGTVVGMRENPCAHDLDGVEPSEEFRARILCALRMVLRDPLENIAVVTHFQVMKTILQHYFPNEFLHLRPANGMVVSLAVESLQQASLLELRRCLPLELPLLK